MKKLLASMICIIVILHYTTILVAGQPENLSAKSAVLTHKETGQILWSLHGDEQVQPGGIVKVLTAMIALEKKSAEDTVTITSDLATYVTSADPVMKLRTDEQIPLKQLISAMLVGTANDAAVAVALYVSGNVDSFIGLMNSRARELGCANSNFVNVTGNNNQNQYSTAEDLAKIMQRAAMMPFLSSVLEMSEVTIAATNLSAERKYVSNNHLIHTINQERYFYEYARGGKTGYIDNFGYNLASYATFDGVGLIAVVLGCDTAGVSFDDTKEIFDYGFDEYVSVTAVKKGFEAGKTSVEGSFAFSLPLKAADDFSFLINKGQTPSNVNKRIEVSEKLSAPISEGEIVGTLWFEWDGQVVGSVPLLAGASALASANILNIIIIFILFMVIIYIFSVIFRAFKE